MDAPAAPEVPVALIGVVLAVVAVLMLWLGRRARRGRLRRNRLVGVRTPLIASSDAAWYPAQRAAALPSEIAAWGWLFAGAALIVFAFTPAAHTHGQDVVGAAIVPLLLWQLVWLIAAAVRGERAAARALAAASGERSGR